MPIWWVTVVVGFVALFAVWTIGTVVFDQILDEILSRPNIDPRAITILNRWSNFWNIWPIAGAVSLIIFGVSRVLRREDDTFFVDLD